MDRARADDRDAFMRLGIRRDDHYESIRQIFRQSAYVWHLLGADHTVCALPLAVGGVKEVGTMGRPSAAWNDLRGTLVFKLEKRQCQLCVGNCDIFFRCQHTKSNKDWRHSHLSGRGLGCQSELTKRFNAFLSQRY